MSELAGTALVGLPNILDSETAYLGAILIGGVKARSTLVAAMAKDNPLIDEVIDHDCEYYIDHEANYWNANKVEIEACVYGIELGYEFIIGSLTAVYLAQSGCRNIKEYLVRKDLRVKEMPVQSMTELERIKQVREGRALIDNSHNGYPETSTDLAYYHFSNYLFDLVGFEGLYQEQAFRMCGNVDSDITKAMMSGFGTGAANAVEMYVQSAEERVIDRIKQAKLAEN